jgi:pSer/pThr/pTyr-binding forkhead associated (FHA) protein
VFLGCPKKAASDGLVDVFVTDLTVRVARDRSGPQVLHVEQSFHGGEYEVGDKRVVGVDLGGKGKARARPSLLAEGEWLTLKFMPDGGESQRRSEELRERESQRHYAELFEQGSRALRQARATFGLDGSEERDPERSLALLREARRALDQAYRFASQAWRDSARSDACQAELARVEAEQSRVAEFQGRQQPVGQLQGAPASPVRSAGPERGGVLCRIDGPKLDVLILAKRELTWGRHSDRDIFLAREPFERRETMQGASTGPIRQGDWPEAEQNYEWSKALSRTHFETRWTESGLELRDTSANGLWLERGGAAQRVSGDTAAPLWDGDVLHLAGNPRDGVEPALTLEVRLPGLGLRAPDLQDRVTGLVGGRPVPRAAVITRRPNCPERQYLLLHGDATVGRNPDCAIVLHDEGVDEIQATLTRVDGCLAVRRAGAGKILLDGQALAVGETRALPDSAELQLGEVRMSFRRFAAPQGGAA